MNGWTKLRSQYDNSDLFDAGVRCSEKQGETAPSNRYSSSAVLSWDASSKICEGSDTLRFGGLLLLAPCSGAGS
eukprot:5461973-Amphidinium_carterae.1